MEFNRDAEVFTKRNTKLGTITRVVIDPETKEVTHLVVDKGFIFSDDKLVPMSVVEKAMEDRVVLDVEDKDELNEMQDFEETFHVASPDADRILHDEHSIHVSSYVFYPPRGTNWWVKDRYPVPPYVQHTVSYNPEGTVALEEGASVIASDDENVGEVETVLTEKSENRVTHLVLSQGLISEKKVCIPSFWISKVEEDEIHLRVDSQLIDSLPEIGTEES